MTPFVSGALTGAAFGVVLYKVGATRYSRVMGMLTLRDTKVMKFAFTAIGVASLLYGAAAALGVAEAWGLVPRVMPYLGPAHVLGGVLFGLGMGVSGLCPGTCMAKTGGRGGATRFTGAAAILGLFVGILAYAGVKEWLLDHGIVAANQKPLTLNGVLGLPYPAVALGFGALMIAIAAVVDRFTPEKKFEPVRERRTALDYLRGEWSWPVGGALGGALVVLATAQSGYLGFSGAVLALVGWMANAVGHPLELVPRITDDVVWRAALILGVLPGGLLSRLFSLPSKAAAEAPVQKRLDGGALARNFGAGATLSLGAMIGGGCTTGAFIAAWPTLSIGSLAMAGTFFAVSMAVGNARLLVVKTLDLTQAQAAGDRAYD